jgi:CRP-like cAMP-binding protein/Fe-S-cluster-containing hydrogenase component 2
MAKHLVVNPPAELERRDTDIELTAEQLLAFSVFARLKKKPSLDKFPGFVRLRRFVPGEVICRQGEQGFTAFYLLSAEDVAALEARRDGGDTRAATAHLAIARSPGPRRGGLLARLGRGLVGAAARAARRRPLYVPMDGPTDIDYETRQAPLHQGEVFGEMSCLRHAPRSATVVADRDCYALEMLRNIFSDLCKDPTYQKNTDEIYKTRVLQNHLRNLPLFAGLSEEQLAEVRVAVELAAYEGGQVIWHEHEPSDDMCIIRSGVVRVMVNASPVLRREDVPDLAGLCAAITKGERQQGTPAARVWQGLSEEARAAARNAGSDPTPILDSLNGLLKDAKLPDADEFQPIVAGAAFRERTREWPANRKSWSALQAARYNRLLLEEGLQARLRAPERTLAYSSRGELLGEIGLILNQPRSATCVAFGHPNDEGGRVELVRIPRALFQKLAAESPALRQQVEAIARERLGHDQEAGRSRPWTGGPAPLLSEEAAKLGLIQGQRLMLIDLDRCTRCDECVRACVNTHNDGQSRLFLDGPRFGNYLVPTTCRSCLDPVCMIGCPVGSIHRGDNGEMRIEDWCIGCELCAKNCPYGSIHMQDVGVIAEEARGWRYQLASAVTDAKWQERGPSGRWGAGNTPFRFDRDFVAALGGRLPAESVPICFTYEFRLSADRLRGDSRFKLELTSVDNAAAVWVNGHELKTDEKPKRGKREFEFAGRGVLRIGRNVVAARVAGTPGAAEVLFGLRLDEVILPALPLAPGVEVTQKAVTQRAVVCDLCSEQHGRVPACVNACPHDAALRVDARRFEFLPR